MSSTDHHFGCDMCWPGDRAMPQANPASLEMDFRDSDPGDVPKISIH